MMTLLNDRLQHAAVSPFFRWSSHAPLAWLSTKKGDAVVNKRSALVLLMLTTFCLGANATDAQGWRWYNEPTAPKKQAHKKAETPSVTLTRTQTLTPTEQMDWFHSYYQDTLNDAAINSQDSTKVEKAMLLNQYVSNKSSEFGMTFKKVLLDNPELSYTKDRPTEQAARSTYLSLERNKKMRAVRTLADAGWGLFFVYKGQEEIDIALAPSVQQFATEHGIELLGVTLDGVALPAIVQNRQNDQHINVPFSPALVLVNPGTGEMKPLAYGFISQDDLLGRFLNVATDFAPDF
jgi:conjugal transfer pilus assembly protein TraF